MNDSYLQFISACHFVMSQLRLYLFTNIWACFYTKIEMNVGQQKKYNISTRVKVHAFFSTITRKFVYFDYTNKFKIFDTIVKPEFSYASKYGVMLIPNRKKNCTCLLL